MYGSHTEILKCKSDEQKVADYDKQEQQGRMSGGGSFAGRGTESRTDGAGGFPFLSAQTFIWRRTARKS